MFFLTHIHTYNKHSVNLTRVEAMPHKLIWKQTLTCCCCSRICSAVTVGGSRWEMSSSSLSRHVDSSSLASWKSDVRGIACSRTLSRSALSLAQLLLCRCRSSILSCSTGSLSSDGVSRHSRFAVDRMSRALLRWLVMSSCSVCNGQNLDFTTWIFHTANYWQT